MRDDRPNTVIMFLCLEQLKKGVEYVFHSSPPPPSFVIDLAENVGPLAIYDNPRLSL